MKLLNEFKEFAVKGNMMEMAIGIIIGASFNSVIDVLVKQMLLPPLSLLSNGLNIDSKKIILREVNISSSGDIINEEVAINYGVFIETFIDFMIVAFTIFIVIKFLNKLKVQAEDPDNNKVSTPKNIKLLTEINDSLKDLNKNLTKKN
jgi:large conductance mechanosensitive channel